MTCPRCGVAFDAEHYGPCAACVTELRAMAYAWDCYRRLFVWMAGTSPAGSRGRARIRP